MNEPQQDLFDSPPAYKLYKPESVRIASFLGGPFAGAYLMHANEKAIGRMGKTWFIWGAAFVIMLLAFVLVFVLPDNFPTVIIPLLYSFAASGFTHYLQGDELKAHEAAGGEYWSGWRAALVGIIGGILLVAVYYGIMTALINYEWVGG
jgi:hypothetical protein